MRPILSAALALCAAAGLGVAPSVMPGWASSTADAQEAADANADAAPATVEEMSLGNPDAAVKVIEYASFTCPHCRAFHDTVFDQLKNDYIDTDKIEFIYREVYFDRYGLWASMVARCGGPEKYFGISDLIYEQQQEWVQGEPAEIAENLRRIGRTAGLDDATLDACLSDAGKAQALVAAYESNAKADEITSTPSFIIDGTKYSNMNYEDFSALLDEKLGE